VSAEQVSELGAGSAAAERRSSCSVAESEGKLSEGQSNLLVLLRGTVWLGLLENLKRLLADTCQRRLPRSLSGYDSVSADLLPRVVHRLSALVGIGILRQCDVEGFRRGRWRLTWSG